MPVLDPLGSGAECGPGLSVAGSCLSAVSSYTVAPGAPCFLVG